MQVFPKLDSHAIVAAFHSEMEAGLAKRPSSLAMIPSFISAAGNVPTDEPVLVLDAGGTNLRACVVRFAADGTPIIERFSKRPMPGTEGEVSADEFFDALADAVESAAPLPSPLRIGFCFSYQAQITPERDGKLLRWTKQIRAPEVVGKLVGAELAERLAKRGITAKITVLNDTVATLLAGRSAGIAKEYSDYVGFILGTGTNIAASIDGMIYNFESGSFNKLPQTEADARLDAETMDPGAYTLEKMTSGGYLGQLGLHAARLAGVRLDFANIETLSNKDFDDFCAVGRAVYERSAQLAAITLAAVFIKSGKGTDAPICANVDGSTFYKTATIDFPAAVHKHLGELLAPHKIKYELVQIDNSPIIGAAVAALANA